MPPKPKKNSSPPNSPSSSPKKNKKENKPNKNKTGNSTPNSPKSTSPSPCTSGNNCPCNPLHFPHSVKNPAAKTPPHRHQQWPKTPPDGHNKLTKTTPIGHEKVQPTLVDKDRDTKSVTDCPNPTRPLEKEVQKNQWPNPEVDEENNSSFLRDQSKDCRPNKVSPGFEENLITGCDEESVNNELQDTICKEENSEEDISDEPCDTDDDKSDTYDVKVITYQVLLTENITHKIY